ncbi:unnamed protein product, partial [Meganyctiphanes norvegica]
MDETEVIMCSVDVQSDDADDIRRETIDEKETIMYRAISFTDLQNWTKRIICHLVMAYLTYTLIILQKWYKASMNYFQPIVKLVVSLIPVIMATVSLLLMIVDQGTDIKTSYEICNVQCQCIWITHSFGSNDMCHLADPNDQCIQEAISFTGETVYKDYCQYARNKSECNKRDKWRPKNDGVLSSKTYRHPLLCLTSIATILGTSIINSTYLFISLWVLYPSVLGYIGLSSDTFFYNTSIKITLLVLYILQMLPYAWLVMNFLINFKVWRIGTMDSLVEKETWENSSKKSKIIFTILEDIPQIMLHSIFISNSVIAHDNSAYYAGIDMLNIGSYLGVISSAASIALTLTLFKGLPNFKATAIQFSTTFIAVG